MNQNHQENPPKLQFETLQECSNLIKLKQYNSNLKQMFALDEYNFDKYVFDSIVKIFLKVKCFDCIDYLQNHATEEHVEKYLENVFSSQSKIFKKQNIRQIFEQLIEVFQSLKNQDSFHFNFLNNEYQVERKELIHQIQKNEKSLEFLQFLVHLTAIDSKFIQCGSNSLNLLVELRADLKYQSFEDIRIKDTSLVGANFAYSNLSGSKFDNVDIKGMNLNGAILFNCKWNNVIIQELYKLDGHGDIVWSVVFSPDGSTLASCSYDNSIRLWDVKTGQQKAKFECHIGDVNSICFSPDGSTLASGSNDQSIHLWDVKTGQQKAKLDGHSNCVNSVCFSPDGSTLASGSNDQSIRLWDVKTGQQKAKLDGHSFPVFSVCFSPDGFTLASGSADICLWDVKTGQLKAELDSHSTLGTICSVCFSPEAPHWLQAVRRGPSVSGMSRRGSRR